MAKRIRIQKLLRLTLTTKGRSIAKHPLLREGVIEVVKASQIGTKTEPTWEVPATGDNLARWQKNWG